MPKIGNGCSAVLRKGYFFKDTHAITVCQYGHSPTPDVQGCCGVRGFTNAAARLYVSHSAISRQIKLLEDELQAMLFVRKGRHVYLTEAGKALVSYADCIFQQIAEAKQAVSAATQEQQGQLHIGTATNILKFFLLPVLESFRKSFPKVSVLTTTGNADRIIEEIRSGAINVGVVSIPVGAHGLTLSPLYQEEFVVVVPSRSALGRRTSRSLKIEELQGIPMITYPQGSAVRRILDSLFAQRGITPNIRLELENEEAVEEAVADNLGISFLSQRRAQNAERVRSLRLSGHRICRDVAMVRAALAGNGPKYAAEFERLCRKHLKSFARDPFIRPLADSSDEIEVHREAFNAPPNVSRSPAQRFTNWMPFLSSAVAFIRAKGYTGFLVACASLRTSCRVQAAAHL